MRENVRMDDPANMQKYLGVVHHIATKEAHGERITEIVFDMESYFRSAIDDYLELSGSKLSKAASPYAPKVEGEGLDKLMEQEGRLAKHAAHLVMKLMYGARMALPYLCIVIGPPLVPADTLDCGQRPAIAPHLLLLAECAGRQAGGLVVDGGSEQLRDQCMARRRPQWRHLHDEVNQRLLARAEGR